MQINSRKEEPQRVVILYIPPVAILLPLFFQSMKQEDISFLLKENDTLPLRLTFIHSFYPSFSVPSLDASLVLSFYCFVHFHYVFSLSPDACFTIAIKNIFFLFMFRFLCHVDTLLFLYGKFYIVKSWKIFYDQVFKDVSLEESCKSSSYLYVFDRKHSIHSELVISIFQEVS